LYPQRRSSPGGEAVHVHLRPEIHGLVAFADSAGRGIPVDEGLLAGAERRLGIEVQP
jgi:hypothetical protein